MIQEGDILKVVSHKSGHAFTIRERIEVEKVMGFGALQCKGKKHSSIISMLDTVPVWDK